MPKQASDETADDLEASAEGASASAALHHLRRLERRARWLSDQRWASNTRRAYAGAWAGYQAWCRARGLQSALYSSRAVVLYLSERSQSLTGATLTVHFSAIVAAFRAAGQPIDDLERDARPLLAGLRRLDARRRRREARPLTLPLLARVSRALPDTPEGLRDRCLLNLGFHGALRADELVGLDLGDLERHAKLLLLHLHATKGNCEPVVVTLPATRRPEICPLRALDAWLGHRGQVPGPLLSPLAPAGRPLLRRLCTRTVTRRVKAAVQAAGLAPAGFSAHSLRAGYATSAALASHSLRQIADHCRHRDGAMSLRYVRLQDATVGQHSLEGPWSDS